MHRLSSLVTRFWRPEAGIFLGIWLALMIGGRQRLFQDPGTLWHTRAGEIMLASGHVIVGDPFSFTAASLHPDQTWIPHQWLAECLMALLHRVGGWDLLQLVAVTIIAGLYTWIGHRLIVCGLHWSLALAFTILAFAVAASHFHVRPHLATMVFLGLTIAWLIDFEAGRTTLARLYWLVPVYALWTNLHGGMLGGVVTMAIALCGWALAPLAGWESPLKSWKQTLAFGVLILACALTAFVNPYGWRLPAVWLNIMGQKRLTEVIREHAPLDPFETTGIMVLVLAAVYAAVFVAACRRRPRVTWFLPFVWLYLACTRNRHGSLFGIAAGLTLAELVPATAWPAFVVRSGSDLFDAARGQAARVPRPLAFIVPAIVVAVAALLKINAIATTWNTAAVPVLGSGWARLDPVICPLPLAKRLDGYPDGSPVFNELNFGGCLIYFAPNVRVFIDDRAELYGEDFMLAYNEAKGASDPPAFLDRFAYDLALTENGSGFDVYFRDAKNDWTVVESTPTATLYRRQPRGDSPKRVDAGKP